MNSAIASPRWRDLVSPHTGIIRAIDRFTKPYTEFDFPVLWQAELANFQLRKQPDDLRYGVGRGMTDEQAIFGAVGEAVERYCGSIVNYRQLIISSYADLTYPAVPPPSFFSFSDTQYSDANFPFPTFDEKTQTSWITAISLTSNQPMLVPAFMVYFDWDSYQPGDYILPVTSNGLASGPNLEFAAYSGLCELIERDAFIINWLNRLPAPRIYFAHRPGIETEILRHYARFGIELVTFYLTTDINIPVVIAMLIDRSGRTPAVATGLGCHLDGSTALRKAIFEVCQARFGDIERKANGAGSHLHQYQDVQQLDDHSAFFYTTTRLGELEFLFEHDSYIAVEDLPTYTSTTEAEKLRTVITRLHSVGAEPYLVDITTPDVAPLGFRVVRTLASELVPIYFGYGLEPLGNRRLFEVPQRLGYGGRRSEADLNPCPHPMA
ncbi:YcaO-like family protein [Nostoc spongiaeforme FACHB-130]|uniref:YcaO-like family protein n=1 Tax=Nostoc spongiaeforme FACHB-130 TaxID=1357510 RepID=A0ABR8FYS7_9NOSO|nr:YcaO-like family protein [Nostoc spongiaeforme]MBD2595408.1 YcaO-like family protein [Nostoc spongiaeforme FACHB-130]